MPVCLPDATKGYLLTTRFDELRTKFNNKSDSLNLLCSGINAHYWTLNLNFGCYSITCSSIYIVIRVTCKCPQIKVAFNLANNFQVSDFCDYVPASDGRRFPCSLGSDRYLNHWPKLN